MATRAAYRPFEVTVESVERLTPSFVRVTFRGDDLHDFAPEGHDQRVKLMLPNALGGYVNFDPSVEEWFAHWRSLTDQLRPPLRTYTVRRVRDREGSRLIDIDFVLHGDGGPASRWVSNTRAGDRVQLIGPDAASGGPWGSVTWNPPSASRQLVIGGDETAAPAIAAVLESLTGVISARAFIEVPHADDAFELPLAPGIELTWLPRKGREHGELLTAAVIDAVTPAAGTTSIAGDAEPDPDGALAADGALWDVPGIDPLTGVRVTPAVEAGLYAWLAGEASVIKALRRHLVREVGIDRRAVAFMGYWRQGCAES